MVNILISHTKGDKYKLLVNNKLYKLKKCKNSDSFDNVLYSTIIEEEIKNINISIIRVFISKMVCAVINIMMFVGLIGGDIGYEKLKNKAQFAIEKTSNVDETIKITIYNGEVSNKNQINMSKGLKLI